MLKERVEALTTVPAEYFGDILHSKGFRVWFLYVFRIINNSSFIEEPIHSDLFNVFQDIYDKKTFRNIINIPPRSGKSTMMVYFVVYCLIKNPNGLFIYTSYSQELLNTLSGWMSGILIHPKIQSMYPILNSKIYNDYADPIDSFWRAMFDNEYQKTKGKNNMYSKRKIETSAGGCVYFASVGSAITGYGVGRVGEREGIQGALIIDDANKTQDIHSKLLLHKVQSYYQDTLISRLNTSKTPVINIQQRIHESDLTGFLLEKYKKPDGNPLFNLCKIPLIKDGVCLNPSQYEDWRIQELMENPEVFSSQYQQEPAPEDGVYVKREYFKYEPHNVMLQRKYEAIYISCDTANKDKAINDPSALLVFGVYDGNFYLIDMVCTRMLFPELLRALQQLINKYKPRTILIEDKASGTQVIQSLKSNGITSVNIIPLSATQGKEVRLNAALESIQAGRLVIPSDATWTFDYVQEMISFPQGKHDDMVDATSHFINWHNTQSSKMRVIESYYKKLLSEE